MTQTIEQLTARVRELEEEIERLSKLAYIGEHQFDDYTWKHRHGELRAQLAKAEQLWQVAQGRCDGLEEKLAKAEQRVAEACAKVCEKTIAALGYKLPSEALRSGAWKEFKK